jgi:hypothetical protein
MSSTATVLDSDPIGDAIERAMADLEGSAAEDTAEQPAEETDPDGQPEGDEPEGATEADDDEDAPDEEGEADEPDDEEEESEDDGDDDDDEPSRLDDDAAFELPDGTTVKGSELRDGYLRQADYTRKTQELAARRGEVDQTYERMAAWYEEKIADPAGWVAEIAADTDNPAGTLAGAIAATDNPTDTFAWVIRGLAEKGKLDPKFVETFGLESVAEQAKHTQAEDRVTRLERKLEQERAERDSASRQQQIIAEYDRQWKAIRASDGVEYDDPKKEYADKVELMRFARDNEIPNLEHAYAAMVRAGERSTAQKESTASTANGGKAPKKAREALERKRKSRAVTRQSAAGSAPPARAKGDIDAAIAEAAEEHGFDLSG